MGGNYYPDRKTTVEECHSLSIFQLRKWGCLSNSFERGEITWNKKYSISYSLDEKNTICTLEYSSTSRDTQEKKYMKYSIHLLSTACYYGGLRYWFKCNRCNKKVATLHMTEESKFLCRKCLHLSYHSQNASGPDREFGVTLSYPELNAMYASMRTTKYKGKYTKRMKKYLRHKHRLVNAFHTLGF